MTCPREGKLPLLGTGTHCWVRKWCKAKGAGVDQLKVWRAFQTVITVHMSAQALEHPSDLTYLSSHHPPCYALAHRKVQDNSAEAELTGSSRITCKEMRKCHVVFSVLLIGVGLALRLSTLLTSSIVGQNSDNHYNNENNPVKLPFILKAQLIFKCQISTEIPCENKLPSLVCVTENTLTEKVLPS